MQLTSANSPAEGPSAGMRSSQPGGAWAHSQQSGSSLQLFCATNSLSPPWVFRSHSNWESPAVASNQQTPVTDNWKRIWHTTGKPSGLPLRNTCFCILLPWSPALLRYSIPFQQRSKTFCMQHPGNLRFSKAHHCFLAWILWKRSHTQPVGPGSLDNKPAVRRLAINY